MGLSCATGGGATALQPRASRAWMVLVVLLVGAAFAAAAEPAAHAAGVFSLGLFSRKLRQTCTGDQVLVSGSCVSCQTSMPGSVPNAARTGCFFCTSTSAVNGGAGKIKFPLDGTGVCIAANHATNGCKGDSVAAAAANPCMSCTVQKGPAYVPNAARSSCFLCTSTNAMAGGTGKIKYPLNSTGTCIPANNPINGCQGDGIAATDGIQACRSCQVSQPGTVPNVARTSCFFCTDTRAINGSTGMVKYPLNSTGTCIPANHPTDGCKGDTIAWAAATPCRSCELVTPGTMPNVNRTACHPCTDTRAIGGGVGMVKSNDQCVSASTACVDDEIVLDGACVSCHDTKPGSVPNKGKTACYYCNDPLADGGAPGKIKYPNDPTGVCINATDAANGCIEDQIAVSGDDPCQSCEALKPGTVNNAIRSRCVACTDTDAVNGGPGKVKHPADSTGECVAAAQACSGDQIVRNGACISCNAIANGTAPNVDRTTCYWCTDPNAANGGPGKIKFNGACIAANDSTNGCKGDAVAVAEAQQCKSCEVIRAGMVPNQERSKCFLCTDTNAINGGPGKYKDPVTGNCIPDPSVMVVNCEGAWSNWTVCNTACTQTSTYRISTQPQNGGTACPVTNGETRSRNCTGGTCPAVNCVGNWGAWSSCSVACNGGMQTRTYTITTPAAGSGTPCNITNGARQNRTCNTQACPDPDVDCVGSWSAWSTCTATCGGGKQTQTYTITTAKSGNGAACEASSGAARNQTCNTQACDTGSGSTAPAAFASILEKHNTYRAWHSTPALQWNDTIATSAAAWAATCKFEHDPAKPYGENLAIAWKSSGYSNAVALDMAVTGWYDEINFYNWSQPGQSTDPNEAIGHFTQVVWYASTQVGCAITTCAKLLGLDGAELSWWPYTNTQYTVCRYNPKGNYLGQYGTNVKSSINQTASGSSTTTNTNCVGAWSSWSTCNATCGGGVQSRMFTVTTAQSGTGTACEAAHGATQSTTCNPQSCSLGGASDEQVPAEFDCILKLHNKLRSLHNTSALKWSNTLATSAATWGNLCKYEHDPDNAVYGENLAIAWSSSGYSLAEALAKAVTNWYAKEINNYNYSNPGTGSGVFGHFTQVIWVGTTHVGCFVKTCSDIYELDGVTKFWNNQNTQYTVCRYNPPGNYEGEYTNNVLPLQPGVNNDTSSVCISAQSTSNSTTGNSTTAPGNSTTGNTTAALGNSTSNTNTGSISDLVLTDASVPLTLPADFMCMVESNKYWGYTFPVSMKDVGLVHIYGEAIATHAVMMTRNIVTLERMPILAAIGKHGYGRAALLPTDEMLLNFIPTTEWDRSGGKVVRNAIQWTSKGNLTSGVTRLGVPPGSDFDRQDLWDFLTYAHNRKYGSLVQPTGNAVNQIGLPVAALSTGNNSPVDVYLIPTTSMFTDEEVAAIQNFARSGKGIVVVGNTKKPGYRGLTVPQLPANKVLAPFGMQLLGEESSGYISMTGDCDLDYFTYNSTSGTCRNFPQAFQPFVKPEVASVTLMQIWNGSRAWSNSLVTGSSDILGTVASLSDFSNPISAKAKNLWMSPDSQFAPEAEKKFKVAFADAGLCNDFNEYNPSNITHRMLMAYMNAYSGAGAANVSAASCNSVFPGMNLQAPIAASTTPRTITVTANNPASATTPSKLVGNSDGIWLSTGLWAPAGATITFTIEPSSTNIGVAKSRLGVQIGSHTETIYYTRETMCRPSRGVIAKTWFGNRPGVATSAGANSVQLGSPWGGLIYVLVPKGVEAGNVTLTITGGVEAPYFQKGKTTTEQWLASRNSPVPWAEIGSDKFMMTLPSSMVRSIEDPSGAASAFDAAAANMSQLVGVGSFGTQRFVLDCDTTEVQYALKVVPGYPAIAPIEMYAAAGAATNLLTTSVTTNEEVAAKIPVLKGLGAVFVASYWVPSRSIDGVAGMLAVLGLESAFGGSRSIAFPNRASDTARYISQGRYNDDSYFTVSSYVFLQLQESLNSNNSTGWDFWSNVVNFFKATPNVDPNIDVFVEATSRVAGRNLNPYFQYWKWPVSEATTNTLAALNLPTLTGFNNSDNPLGNDTSLGNFTGSYDWPLPYATTALIPNDYTAFMIDLPDLSGTTSGISFESVLLKNGRILLSGEAMAVIPAFDTDIRVIPSVTSIVAAMGRAGLGRGVFLATPELVLNYVNQSSGGVNMWASREARIIRNAIYWAGQGGGPYPTRIGVPPGSSFNRSDIWNAMIQIAAIGRNWQYSNPTGNANGNFAVAPSALGTGADSPVDVYIMPTDKIFTDAEIELVQRFAASGKGLIAVGNALDIGLPSGYAWQDIPVNKIMKPFGMQVTFSLDYLGGGIATTSSVGSAVGAFVLPGVSAPLSWQHLVHPDHAARLLVAHLNGSNPVDENIAKGAMWMFNRWVLSNVDLAKPGHPLSKQLWQSANSSLAKIMVNYYRSQEDNGRCTALHVFDPYDMTAWRYVNQFNDVVPPESMQPAPCSHVFPGVNDLPAGGIPGNTDQVSITMDANNPLRPYSVPFWPEGLCGGEEGAWLSTGLWAPAGKAVTVKIEQTSANYNTAKANLGVQIGMHFGDLFVCRNLFCRPPGGIGLRRWFGNLPHSNTNLPGVDTLTLANQWGGLIFILVPKGVEAGSVTLTVTGAVQAPFYKKGRSTTAQWMSNRNSVGPWAEIGSNKFSLVVPSKMVRGMDGAAVDAVATFWDQMIAGISDLFGISSDRPVPGRLVLDCDTAAFHYALDVYPGHPMTAPIDLFFNGTAVDPTVTPSLLSAMYGNPAEVAVKLPVLKGIAAQHSYAGWVPPNSLSGTYGLVATYMLENYAGINRSSAYPNRASEQAAYFFNGTVDELEQYSTYMLLQLQENMDPANMTVGWNFWKAVHKQAQQDSLTGRTVDQYALDSSNAAGKNLAPFYQQWKWPVSASGASSVQARNLPAFNFDATAACGSVCSACCVVGFTPPNSTAT